MQISSIPFIDKHPLFKSLRNGQTNTATDKQSHIQNVDITKVLYSSAGVFNKNQL